MTSPAPVCVIVPAYNEARLVPDVLAGLCALPYHVVLVDDGSQDGTAAQALRFPVTVLRHVCNLGQGAALQTGIDYALSLPTTRYIVTFDSDGQHDPADIARLLQALEAGGYDVALGSRFIAGGAALDIRASRRLSLACALALTRLTTGLALTDTHNGLRAFTAEAAARLRITQNRMAHASQILAQIAGLGLRYCEAPVTVRYTPYSRAKGQSLLDGVNILWEIIAGRAR